VPKRIAERRAHAEGIRMRILRTAARGFRERGYKGTTLQQIADDLGYTAPALYKYFRSKEEIYHELMRTIAELHARQVVAPAFPRGADFNACVEELVRRVFRITRENTDFYRLLQYHYQLGGDDAQFVEARKTIRETVMAFRKKIIDLIRRGVAEGTELNASVGETALALEALVLHYSRLWLADPTSFELEEKVPIVAQFFLSGAVKRAKGRLEASR
jgi:AcrR family transcriptional regulator